MSTAEPSPANKHVWRRVFAGVLVLMLLLFGWWLVREPAPDFGDRPEFDAISDIPEMKAAFYEYLTPIVEHHNRNIEAQREQLLGIIKQLQDGGTLGYSDRSWLLELAQTYELDPDETEPLPLARRLLRRVDIVPVELALVQAAKESAWGRSRFAVEANNFFGQWCYEPGCGSVPSDRAPDATHEVEQFDSVAESVRRYINNLNTHERYRKLRDIRAQLRASQQPITGVALAEGLVFYSERRDKYVQEVKSMIRRYLKFQTREPGAS